MRGSAPGGSGHLRVAAETFRHPRGMASWRDTASDQVQADLDALLNAVLPFAEQTALASRVGLIRGADLSSPLTGVESRLRYSKCRGERIAPHARGDRG